MATDRKKTIQFINPRPLDGGAAKLLDTMKTMSR